MTTPQISPQQVQSLANLVGIPLDHADLPEVANRFSSLMQELTRLQDLDLDGIEPVAIFPDPDFANADADTDSDSAAAGAA